MTEWRSLVPTTFPPARTERISGAILRPFGLRDASGVRLAGGVFRADGSPVDLSSSPPTGPMVPGQGTDIADPVVVRRGAWVFGGIALNHFGHVMVETGARLWAVRQLLDQGVELEGVLFFQKKSTGLTGDQRLPASSAAFLTAFSPDIPVVFTTLPERVETLYVPELGISFTPDRFVGLPEQRRFFRDRAARIAARPGPLDIYVSRTGKGARGGYLFEADIEAAMVAAGYLIYHPQLHPIEAQIATYRAARRLVSIDGSALHLAATALPADARVAILARRQFFAWAIADQIAAFAGCKVSVIEAPRTIYNLAEPMRSLAALRTIKGWSSSYLLADFDRLGLALVQAGFLQTAPRWPCRTADDLAAEIKRAAARHGDRLLAVPDDLLPLEPYHGAHLTRAPG